MRLFSLSFVFTIIFIFLSSVFLQNITFALSVGDTKTFKVSAYYSPLAGQEKYVSGSYAADLRMNGNGTHGADGTPVYVGMISAPYTYDFGTKIYLPGLGIGTVHDRGGAIYAGKGYDRLDIWMGYGDEGRIRAINWGMQMVEGKIVASNTSEGFVFGGKKITTNTSSVQNEDDEMFSVPLSIDAYGKKQEIAKMQKFLQSQGFFHVKSYGYFGPITEKAVLDFQIEHEIVQTQYDFGAGVWGPKTRRVANKILKGEFVKRKTVITSYSFSKNLWRGKNDMERSEVKKMQKFLKDAGFYNGTISGKFNAVTEKAVFNFQVSKNIINNLNQKGAGVWGPLTRKMAEGK